MIHRLGDHCSFILQLLRTVEAFDVRGRLKEIDMKTPPPSYVDSKKRAAQEAQDRKQAPAGGGATQKPAPAPSRSSAPAPAGPPPPQGGASLDTQRAQTLATFMERESVARKELGERMSKGTLPISIDAYRPDNGTKTTFPPTMIAKALSTGYTLLPPPPNLALPRIKSAVESVNAAP